MKLTNKADSTGLSMVILYRSTKFISINVFLLTSSSALADWSSNASTNLFYTDDVALFSVTRRLSLQDDPTQPSVDRPQQGGDFVVEPQAGAVWLNQNALGEMAVSLDAAGYIFSQQTDYSHALFETKFSQTLTTDTQIVLEYNLVPELFLGKNVLPREDGQVKEKDEQLTTHVWTLQFEQTLTYDLRFRVLSRYGLRNYKKPFEHRDTEFWTLGPHVEWSVSPGVDLLIGYHFERGFAKPRRISSQNDDVSYINHYASAELKILLLEKLSANFILDFEKNDFTARQQSDEHYQTEETVYQGEIELCYRLNDATALKLGWQHGSRKLNTEGQSIRNNNFWFGFDYEL